MPIDRINAAIEPSMPTTSAAAFMLVLLSFLFGFVRQVLSDYLLTPLAQRRQR